MMPEKDKLSNFINALRHGFGYKDPATDKWLTNSGIAAGVLSVDYREHITELYQRDGQLVELEVPSRESTTERSTASAVVIDFSTRRRI